MLGAENQNLSEDLKTIETELRDLYRNTPSRVRTVVASSIKQISSELVDRFYSTMSAQPGAHFFLDHETVNKKLRQALKHWLEETFSASRRTSPHSLGTISRSDLPMRALKCRSISFREGCAS